jgi:acylphosphatase
MARRIIAHGHVQGVFFRASMTDLAREHGVAGWVRNDPGGTLTAHLEGPEAAVDKVVAWIRGGGPERARVERVEEREVPGEGHTTFTVRRR